MIVFKVRTDIILVFIDRVNLFYINEVFILNVFIKKFKSLVCKCKYESQIEQGKKRGSFTIEGLKFKVLT